MIITREMIERSLEEIISRRKGRSVDKVPPGWLTAEQAAEISHISGCRMRIYLRDAHKSGEIQKKFFRVLCGTTQAAVRPVAHYLLGSKK